MQSPIIGITMGDAAGIGPEIIVKALAVKEVYDFCRPVVVGDAQRLRKAARIVGSKLPIHTVPDTDQAGRRFGEIDCIDVPVIPDDLPFGQLSAAAGHGAYEFIAKAVQLAQAGRIDAICTAPLNKEALHAGGHLFPGHTELLAKLSNTPEVSMMLMTPKLRVIHVTTHIGLLDAVRKIEPGLVERTIRRGHAALVRAGIEKPKIAVCGINPHAGEHGLFGTEDADVVEPAVAQARSKGIDCEGPVPADTVFLKAVRGGYDLVVAMYHDQGHVPMKLLDFERTVNVSLGLPVIRTSVDHGTAFDIAGKGIADPGSMIEAMRLAVTMAGNKARRGS